MRYVHGLYKTPTYQTWAQMKYRVQNPNCKDFAVYSERGMDERWQKFENFYADMGERPDGMTLDRIDNDGPYSKDNCRWATMQRQGWNKSKNRMIEFRGEKKPLSEWAFEFGLSRHTVRQRVNLGWPLEQAFGLEQHEDMRGKCRE